MPAGAVVRFGPRASAVRRQQRAVQPLDRDVEQLEGGGRIAQKQLIKRRARNFEQVSVLSCVAGRRTGPVVEEREMTKYLAGLEQRDLLKEPVSLDGDLHCAAHNDVCGIGRIAFRKHEFASTQMVGPRFRQKRIEFVWRKA